MVFDLYTYKLKRVELSLPLALFYFKILSTKHVQKKIPFFALGNWLTNRRDLKVKLKKV